MLLRRKLPKTSFVLLVVSLASAAAAALVMRAYAARLEATRPDGGPAVEVVVATRAIARGATISAEALAVVAMPSRFVPPQALHDPARTAGRVAAADVAAGEVLTRLRLLGEDAGRIASLVPAGQRAVQLPATASAGAEPGDRVDVVATFGQGSAHAEIVAEGVEVLAVRRDGGGTLGGGTTGATGLVVLVEPDQAERLAFAATFATISIAVRGPADAIDLAPGLTGAGAVAG